KQTLAALDRTWWRPSLGRSGSTRSIEPSPTSSAPRPRSHQRWTSSWRRWCTDTFASAAERRATWGYSAISPWSTGPMSYGAGGQVCIATACTSACDSARPCPMGESCLDGLCTGGSVDSGNDCPGGCDGGTCVKNACYYSNCFGTLCPQGEVCVDGACLEQD